MPESFVELLELKGGVETIKVFESSLDRASCCWSLLGFEAPCEIKKTSRVCLFLESS